MCWGGRGEGGGCTAGGGGGERYSVIHVHTQTHNSHASSLPPYIARAHAVCRVRSVLPRQSENERERERARESEGRKSQAVSTDFTCSPTSEPPSVAVPASQSHGGNGGPASVLAEVRERQRTPERGTIRLERERETAKRKRCGQ